MSKALSEYLKAEREKRLRPEGSTFQVKPIKYAKEDDLASMRESMESYRLESEDMVRELENKTKEMFIKQINFPVQKMIHIPVSSDQGGLGTTVKPTAGQVPIANSDGTYTPGTLTQTNLNVVSKVFGDSPFTASSSNDVVLCNCTGGAITVNLPAAATAGSGKVLRVKKTDSSANAVTVEGNGAETLDGALNVSLAVQYQAVTLISDGSNWHAFA